MLLKQLVKGNDLLTPIMKNYSNFYDSSDLLKHGCFQKTLLIQDFKIIERSPSQFKICDVCKIPLFSNA